jgi:small GTP-binding protein
MDELKMKVCLLGDSEVGKTSLIRRFVHNEFDDKYLLTIGTKTSKKSLVIDHPKQDIKLNTTLMINDIMGQFNYSNMMETYIQGAVGGILVCDLTNKETLENLKGWVEYVHRVIGEIPLVIVANKSDLTDDFKFYIDELQEFASAYKAHTHVTSAKTGENVEAMFKDIAEKSASYILG